MYLEVGARDGADVAVDSLAVSGLSNIESVAADLVRCEDVPSLAICYAMRLQW